jgi:DNA-binding GntR family transcriptional regulator
MGPGQSSGGRILAGSWQLREVERASTTEHVLRVLRAEIIEGRIPQGEPLREIHLAHMLGTGRSAIREALRQLVQEGLVEYRLNRGAIVRVMSLADRLDVYVAREAIEVGVARRLLDAPEPPDLVDLEDACERLAAAATGDGPVSEELIDADIRFHQELVRLADSPRLTRAYETLAAETQMLLRHHPPYPPRDYVDDHRRLLEALRARDAALPDLVAEHLRLSARLIAEQLSEEERA